MRRLLFAAAAMIGTLYAGPITYQTQLYDGIPVTGVNNQATYSEDDPIGAVYYGFFATAGSPVTIDGDRLTGAYDMSFWVLSGLYADTNDFGAALSTAANRLGRADDEDSPNIPGPYGDPRFSFTASSTGFHTVAVTNWASGANPPYDFRLTATGVSPIPEPSTLALAGFGVIALLALRRRK